MIKGAIWGLIACTTLVWFDPGNGGHLWTAPLP